jgi:N-acetylmuramoyl-L-alanine amidase
VAATFALALMATAWGAVPVREAVWAGPLAALAGVGRPAPLVALDPGHGGRDPGATAPDGVHEKHWTLVLARELGDCLRRRGLRVALSRTADVHRPLAERARWAGDTGAALLVSIHLNALPEPDRAVLEVYHAPARRPEPGALPVPGPRGWPRFRGFEALERRLRAPWRGSASERLARRIHEALLGPDGSGLEGVADRGVKAGDFLVLRETDVPAVLVEPTTLSNPAQAARLHDPAFRAVLSRRLCAGIAGYLRGR